jgi:nitroimidazol reductase NimA-like FMN-containing flavoprotein (pyridoxamine 5'-phosphate oxidase superfamily)
MRPQEKPITDRKILHDLLREAMILHLGLSDEGIPYIVPLNFVFFYDRLYFHSSPIGRKMEILSRNPRVCFEVESEVEVVPADDACDWGMRCRSVIGEGVAMRVEDEEEKRVALQALMRKYSGRSDWTFSLDQVQKVAVIRVRITEIGGRESGY